MPSVLAYHIYLPYTTSTMPTKPTMLVMSAILAKPTIPAKRTMSAQPNQLTVSFGNKHTIMPTLPAVRTMLTDFAWYAYIVQTTLELQLCCGTFVALDMLKSVNEIIV